MKATMRFTNAGIPEGATVTVLAFATGGTAETVVRYENNTYRVSPHAV